MTNGLGRSPSSVKVVDAGIGYVRLASTRKLFQEQIASESSQADGRFAPTAGRFKADECSSRSRRHFSQTERKGAEEKARRSTARDLNLVITSRSSYDSLGAKVLTAFPKTPSAADASPPC